jgi:hypothetical protein
MKLKLKSATELVSEEFIKIYKIFDQLETDKDSEIKRLNNISDKLEQRISSLEKVLASHAKCIGELRVKDNQFEINADGTETTKDSIL